MTTMQGASRQTVEINLLSCGGWLGFLMLGVREVKRLYHLWGVTPGVTIHNGEYHDLIDTLGNLVKSTEKLVCGQAILVGQMDALTGRVSKLEHPFSPQ